MENSNPTASAHTPGPWRFDVQAFDLDKNPFANFRISTEAPTHPDIADVFFRDDEKEAEANARLFVAAPDLRRDSQQLYDAINRFLTGIDVSDCDMGELEQAMDAMEATWRKADGR